MQTSGLVLDVHDDVGGGVLRSMFPTKESLPDFVKSAHALTTVEHRQLPDESFALVLVNGTDTMRKFACIDAGNTALSVLYFLKNAHKLPEVARQRTAENLKIASAWYDLDIPEELEKEAGLGKTVMNHIANNPIGSALTALSIPSTIQGVGGKIKQNLSNVRAGEAMNGPAGGLRAMAPGMEHLASANLDDILLAEAFKVAETTGTTLMPISADPKKAPATGMTTLKIAHMNPVVDVSDIEVTSPLQVKRAAQYALHEEYPLDSYAQVKQAAQFFADFGKRLEPDDRHEFCVNLVKRASALRITLPDHVRKYGSEKYASAAELEMGLDSRRLLLQENPEARAMLGELAKTAAAIPAGDYCQVLAAFDEKYELSHLYDSDVMDPFYSTYGFSKTAEEKDEEFTDQIDNYFVKGCDLMKLRSNHQGLKSHFSGEFAEEFRKDPVGVYKSMPRDQKKLLIRLATENSPM